MKSTEGALLFVCLFGCTEDTVDYLDPDNSVISLYSITYKARFNLAAWKEFVLSQSEYPHLFYNLFSPKLSDKILCLSKRLYISYC